MWPKRSAVLKAVLEERVPAAYQAFEGELNLKDQEIASLDQDAKCLELLLVSSPGDSAVVYGILRRVGVLSPALHNGALKACVFLAFGLQHQLYRATLWPARASSSL